ncbi:hypothetical protein BU26DRAFT_559007 [Trematosphaeria pertusa]|uniref:Uncharacterized protein n=1 Tax=Trematosphaeria pertusa TaxID=390896 RepID=A0A6A6IUS6_9PLEO|nr:uncharacterized protein BU26DRAFT_559007 [Trematosphaeria pertusa]KAF2254311.1 hypothetical protein BU26DRAFT_559007 [Trematosphaeria pertusa]
MSTQYDFEAFERQRATKEPYSTSTATRQQLNEYFKPQSDEASEDVSHGYYKWLDWFCESVDIGELVAQEDWTPETERKMPYALRAFSNRTRTWELGSSGGTKTRLSVCPVFCTVYYPPENGDSGLEARFDPEDAYGPVLYTNYHVRVPEDTKAGAVLKSAATNLVEDPNIFSKATVQDSNSVTKDSETAAKDSNCATTHSPTALSTFTTKLIHLGNIRAAVTHSYLPKGTLDTSAPYGAVALISGGHVKGIFAIPVDGPRGGTIIYEDLCLAAWEPEKRGVYYLGRDLADCGRREWVLCGEVEAVEVISFKDASEQ